MAIQAGREGRIQLFISVRFYCSMAPIVRPDYAHSDPPSCNLADLNLVRFHPPFTQPVIISVPDLGACFQRKPGQLTCFFSPLPSLFYAGRHAWMSMSAALIATPSSVTATPSSTLTSPPLRLSESSEARGNGVLTASMRTRDS